MLKLGVVVASLALVGVACGSDPPTDEVSSETRSSSTTASTAGTSTTTSTLPASTTTTSSVAETTTTLPSATATSGPDAEPEPAPAASGGNGQLADAALTTVTSSCRIRSDLAPRLQGLLDAAHADGIALWPETQPYTTGAVPPHLTSCYRELEIQQWWRDHYCGQGACGMAAVPGTSVHGWGRAVDFEQGGQELAFEMDGYQWLVAHASTYGFAQPAWAGPSGSAPEPWHWEAT